MIVWLIIMIIIKNNMVFSQNLRYERTKKQKRKKKNIKRQLDRMTTEKRFRNYNKNNRYDGIIRWWTGWILDTIMYNNNNLQRRGQLIIYLFIYYAWAMSDRTRFDFISILDLGYGRDSMCPFCSMLKC